MGWKEETEEFKAAGFSDEEIRDEEFRLRKEMTDSGFGLDEVDGYFGVKEPDMSAMKAEISKNLTNAATAGGAREAKSILDAVEAGFQMSVTGLMARDKLPDVVLPEQADMFYRIASQVGSIAGDVPAMVAGGVGGYFAGAVPGTAAGAAVGTVVPGVGNLIGAAVGNVVGGTVGAAAASNALPAMIRKYYVEALEKGEVQDFNQFWERASTVLLEGTKQGAIGAATMGTGRVALKVASPALSTLGAKTAQSVTEVATMTTLGAAMEGKAPTIQDFTDAAIVVGGLAGSAKISGKLIKTFQKTGVSPSELAMEAANDPVLKQDILKKGDEVPSRYKGFQDVPDANPSKPLDTSALDPDTVELIAKPHETSTPDSPPTGVSFPPLQEKTITLDYVDYLPMSETTIRKNAKIPDGDQILFRGVKGDGSEGPWVSSKNEAIDFSKDTGASAAIEISSSSKVDANGKQQVISLYGLKSEADLVPEKFRAKKEAYDANLSPQEKAVNDQIVFDRKIQKDKPTWNDIYENAVDKFDPIKVFVDSIRGGKMIDPGKHPYVLARLTAGSRGKASAAIEFGAFDFKDSNKIKSKSLKEIFEPFKDDIESFERFAVASRAVELEARGIKSGLKLEDAQAVIAKGGKKYQKAFQDLVQFQNSILEYARDSGVIGKDAFDKMTEANKSYVPFHRLFDEKQGTGKNIGSGLNVKNPVKGIKGSDKKIVSPLETIVRNTHVLMELAERNRAVNALVDLALESPAGAELVKRVPPKFKATKVSGKEIQKFLDENGLEAGDIPDGLTVFRPKTGELEANQIVRIKDGKPEIYEVPDEALARAVKGMEAPEMGLLMKILSKPTELFKAGITLAPEFAVKNLVRDQLSAWIQSRNGYVPYIDFVRGLGSVIGKDKDFQSWLKEGGANGAMVSIDRDYIKADIFSLSKQTGLMDRTINVVRSPLETLKVISEIAEQATRVGEFKKAKAKGKSGAEAAFAARESTVDFARMGAKTKALNQISAFFNMGIQGQDRLIRELAERPKETMAKLAAGITLPSVLLWAANRDDDRVKDIPRWQKDLFWIVPVGDTIYRFPKPHEPGVIFGSSIERILDAYFENDPKAGKQFAETVIGGMLPNYLPTFATPALEHFANKSTFTGSPIIPKRFEGLLPELQYSEFNSETGKILGRFMAGIGFKESTLASPAIIDNYIRGWTGTLGAYALNAADKALVTAGVVPDPVKPADTLADLPFVKAFVIRYPSSGTEGIKNFYEDYGSAKKFQNSFKYLVETNQPEKAEKLITGYAEKFAQVDGSFEALQNMSKFVRKVYQNTDMTRDEKRQIIDDTYIQMNMVAKQGNELMRELSKAFKEAEKK